jgi:hypothetical protein
MNDLTTKLQEIKARAEAATPGPWEEYVHTSIFAVIEGTLDSHRGHIADASINDEFDPPQASNNADFIANARQDIPALLRLVKVLREQRDMDINVYACFLDPERKTMTTDNKAPRRWTLCYGEYQDAAWNGPTDFDGTIEVIEASAYDAIEAELQRERRKVEHIKQRFIDMADANYFATDDCIGELDAELEAIDKGATGE